MGLLYVIVGMVALFLVPGFVFADSVEVPVLVNLYGFEQPDPRNNDEDRWAEIEDAKWRIQSGLDDANQILAKCHDDFDAPILKLGDPQSEEPKNITYVIIPPENAETGGSTAEEREQTLREMARQGRAELNRMFGEDIGQKIYVVTDEFNLGNKVARGWNQGQVIWINNDGVQVARGMDGVEGISGPYILHELLHNTGLEESDHGAPGNVFHSPTDLNKDREITREQCDGLVEYFQNHGATNATQKSSFVPLPQKTYYSLLVPLTEQDQHASSAGMVEMYLDEDGWATANFVWSGFFSESENIDTSILIGLDLDNDSDTSISEHLDGADAQIQVDIKGEDGVFYATGRYSATKDGETVNRPLDYASLNVASAGDDAISSDSIRIKQEIEYDGLVSQIPVSITILDFPSDTLNSYSLEMDKLLERPKILKPVQDSSIPDWIKNSAGWWAEGTITDDDFIQGIQYLIKEGILDVSAIQYESGQPSEIPAWVKNNAGWWAEGIIPDQDFIAGIQYLMKIGIIRL